MKKVSSVLLLVCCVATISLQAQQTSNKSFFYTAIKGNTIVAVNKVITHIAPSVGAAIDDSLTFGTPVQVLMLVPYSESTNGIEVPWAKCIYKKGEFNKVTFILASNLALHHANSNGTSSCIGFQYSTTDSIFFQIKLNNSIKNINYTQTVGFEKQHLADSFRVQLISPTGLQKLNNIFGIHIYLNKIKHSYHFLECETNNYIFALEKVYLRIDTKELMGKVWEFPSAKKVKKNSIALYDYTSSAIRIKIPTIVYKLQNCTLK